MSSDDEMASWHFITENNNSLPGFYDSLSVYVNRPNILNKRIFGCCTLSAFEISPNVSIKMLIFNIFEIIREGTGLHGFYEYTKLMNLIPTSNLTSDHAQSHSLGVIFLQKLLPKSKDKFCNELQIVIIDNRNNSFIFIPLSSADKHRLTPNFAYKFVMLDSLKLYCQNRSETTQINCSAVSWLKTSVFPKIVKWASLPSLPTSSPIALVNIDKYNEIRLHLRAHYADKFIKMWPDDGTDAKKFVHEDIAIAAYLLTLWDAEDTKQGLTKSQTFVDLGCGNGLLTHILSSEGYSGIGIDLRRRKLWDLLPETDLKEVSIVPSSKCLFPDYEWIIGNHSDELTPWIPVIAARSSYKMKVFLLPCCSFTFDGKFQRSGQGSSQYQNYLNFIEKLCYSVGFNVKRDRLRIPSTKRTCFVCTTRHYQEEEEEVIEESRSAFIIDNSKQTCQKNQCSNEMNWSNSFQPREKIIKVQNCTQLDRNLIQNIVKSIATILLENGDGKYEVETEEGNKILKYGGAMQLSVLADILGSQVKLQLKEQNGGLQTVIRNHRHIFEVKDGSVVLTKPLSKSAMSKQIMKRKKYTKLGLQSRPCWFYHNHPDKCPYSSQECSYSHV